MPEARRPAGLFVTDLDGTLLGSDGRFSQSDLDTLGTLRGMGVKTAVATGRSLYSLLHSTAADLPVDYVIFSTGAGVMSLPGRNLAYRLNLSPALVEQALQFLNGTSFDFMLHRPVPDNHHFLYRRRNVDNTDFESRIDRYRDYGMALDSVNGSDFEEAAQFLVVVPPGDAADALSVIRPGLPGLSIVHSTSPLDHASTWIECFHPGVSKGKTAAWLAAELGVGRGDTMAIGNDFNDLDLLEWAGNSFVVANAPDALRERFRQVAHGGDGGVAEAVRRWLDSRG
jgi:Cof subfamily protein (haloacid dehalogenase superfamily)